MKKQLLCVILTVVLLLTGCEGTFGGINNVEELLRAPQTEPLQSDVQKALNGYLGETLQLKYPRGGDVLSPVLFADFEGDGETEAAVLYTTESKGQNVHLAILEKRADGWEVSYEIEGLSTEISSIEMVALKEQGAQILVGYANATLSDLYLAVYDYKNETVTPLYQQAYDAYLAADFSGNGVKDLVVVPPTTQPGALTAVLLHAEETEMRGVQTFPLDERFLECKGLYVTKSGETRGLVVDGALVSGGLSSQVFCMRNNTLTLWPQDAEIDVPRRSLRYLQTLKATDFSAMGAVEVPCSVLSVPTLTSARRFYFVTWQNYLADPATERFGVYDATNGYFVQMPNNWQDKINITDGAQPGAWQVRLQDGNAMLLSVRVENRNQSIGAYTVGAALGEKNVLLYITDECSPVEANLLRAGVTTLQ
ncbi:MAG: hypothetical protein RSD23_01340 [Ruthenibacterium sp.]